jgi:hypothetical protein
MYANYILIFQWENRCEQMRTEAMASPEASVRPEPVTADVPSSLAQGAQMRTEAMASPEASVRPEPVTADVTSSLQKSHVTFSQHVPIQFNIIFLSIIYFPLLPETYTNTLIYIQLCNI